MVSSIGKKRIADSPKRRARLDPNAHDEYDAVAGPQASSTFAAAAVHFTPGARTAWHTYPHGQTIYVTEGVGHCQREGGPVEAIRPGDRVFFEPEEEHWHGAAPDRFMAHVAMLDVDENPSLASRYQAMSIPLLVMMREGREVDRIVGAAPKAQIEQRLPPA